MKFKTKNFLDNLIMNIFYTKYFIVSPTVYQIVNNY